MENKKLPISAVMVIYNEENVLERALQSFCNTVDEIIIVHDGNCTDRSLEIARRYTDNIYELEHIGHAEWHRPFTYEKTKNDWILQLDADEYLSEELKKNLEKMIEGEVDIYEVPWSTFHRGKHWLWYHKRMLFRKSQVYFIGAIQEGVKSISDKATIQKTGSPLLHEPSYNNYTLKNFRHKWKKWAKIQAEELVMDFSTFPKWNCQLTGWEKHRQMRINHPILFGMFATTAYNALFSLRDFLIHRNLCILKLGAFSFLYHFHLYYYLLILKHEKDIG